MTASVFHEILGEVDYPMVIVTAGTSGCLVGFATQCSIDPPLHLVCISDANDSHVDAMRASTVAVHFLDRHDRHLAEIFGELTGDAVDKLSLVDWRPGPEGVPVLDAAAAWFAGRVVARHQLGDHTGLVLEPIDGERRRPLVGGTQLGFQDVKGMPPGHAP